MSRIRSSATAAALALVVASVAALAAPSTAVAATTSQVHAINAFTFDAASPGGQVSVCIDGVSLAHGLAAGSGGGSAAITPGAHDVQVTSGDTTDCSSPTVTAPVTVPASASSTLMVFRASSDPYNVSVVPDLSDCIAAGQSRLVVRHAAYEMGIDIHGTLPGAAADSILFTNLKPGEQGSVDLTAGTLTGNHITDSGDPTSVATSGDVVLPAGQLVTMYWWGGADGSIGAFTVTTSLAACEVASTTSPSTSTTVAATSTTVAATAAQPVTATPTFTG